MTAKIKSYNEAELIKLFGLQRLVGNTAHPLMVQWLVMKDVDFRSSEQELFDEILEEAKNRIAGWQEEDLKMKFIAIVLRLGQMKDNALFNTYFEKTVSATINGYFLKARTDFMAAKGILDTPEKPYFHFQEWKPLKKPTGDSMAQLLEALLVAQQLNNDGAPLYGCEVVGKQWNFVILTQQTYCISKSFDCTERDDLMSIVATLRNFKTILAARLR